MSVPDIEYLELPAIGGRVQGVYGFLGTAPGRRLAIERDGDELGIREINSNLDWPWDSQGMAGSALVPD